MPHSRLDRTVSELLRLFLLHDSRHSTMAAYSKGMRQRAVILSHGRLVAEHRVSDDRSGDSDSLEQLFVRVTEQEDYRPIAREILDVMQHA